MKMSTRFSDAIHLLAFIHIYKGKIPLSSETIAQSIETSSVMIRKLMGELRQAGLIETTHGIPNPKLAHTPTQISLLDIYLAIEKEKPLFQIDYKTNPECIIGGNIQETLSEYYKQAEIAAKAKLDNIKLSDIIDTILVKQKEKKLKKKYL